MRKITQDLEGRLSIGILGGSFNPAHCGHLDVTQAARQLIGLDRCWWLVSPANPLKDPKGYAPLSQRVSEAEKLTSHLHWLTVSAIEAGLGTKYTVDTMRVLRERFPHLRPVWIMGADSLASFHFWKDWREITRLVPIAVISRPGYDMAAIHSPAARALARFRLPDHMAKELPRQSGPAWVFLRAVHNPISSTLLRRKSAP